MGQIRHGSDTATHAHFSRFTPEAGPLFHADQHAADWFLRASGLSIYVRTNCETGWYMVVGMEYDDFWADLPRTSSKMGSFDAGPALIVEDVEGFEPLDAQFGMAEPVIVPSRLHDFLFDESGGSKDEAASPLHVYAILDAAKVPGLPEMLEASSLECACLFQGRSEEEMGGVSPWLVRLLPDDPFTRKVFTAGDGSWHLWDRAPGIVVGSKADMTAVRRHLRRFTRVQDRRGKWFMFRFWEADYLLTYLMALATTKQADFMGPIRIIVTIGPGVRLVRWGEGS